MEGDYGQDLGEIFYLVAVSICFEGGSVEVLTVFDFEVGFEAIIEIRCC